MNSKRIALGGCVVLGHRRGRELRLLCSHAYAAGCNLHDREGGGGHEAVVGRIADQRR